MYEAPSSSRSFSSLTRVAILHSCDRSLTGSSTARTPGSPISRPTLEVGPHPDLSETQARVIALEYGMRGGKAKIKVRRALLYYALKRLGLDTAPEARTPQDQQIVLINRDEIFSGIRAAGAPEGSK